MGKYIPIVWKAHQLTNICTPPLHSYWYAVVMNKYVRLQVEMCPEYPAQSSILGIILMDYKEEGNCPAYTNIGRETHIFFPYV